MEKRNVLENIAKKLRIHSLKMTSRADWKTSIQEVAPAVISLQGVSSGGLTAVGMLRGNKSLTPTELEDEISNIPLTADPDEIAEHIKKITTPAQVDLPDKANLEAIRKALSKKTDDQVLAIIEAAKGKTNPILIILELSKRFLIFRS